MRTPRVSIVMPVYNGERFLNQAIQSLLRQNFSDFELILINDGSRDSSASVLDTYARSDARITVITHTANLGIVIALNEGIARARGQYVARMDADDIAAPTRFEKQVQALDSDSNLSLVGSWAETIDSSGQTVGRVRLPTHDGTIKAGMLLGNQFIHSATMFRRCLFDTAGPYRNRFPHAEDYDLWLRMIKYSTVSNIPAYLIRLRRYDGGVSYAHPQAQGDATLTLRRQYLTELLRQGQRGRHVAIQALRINPYDPLLRQTLCAIGREGDIYVNAWQRWRYDISYRVRQLIKQTLSSPRFHKIADRLYPH